MKDNSIEDNPTSLTRMYIFYVWGPITIAVEFFLIKFYRIYRICGICGIPFLVIFIFKLTKDIKNSILKIL